MYPHIKPTGVRYVVVNVAVVSDANDGESDQSTHVERKDRDEQRLHTFQVTVQENGHKHDLQQKHSDGQRR